MINKSLQSWMPNFIFQSLGRAINSDYFDGSLMHIVLCLVDHFEPFCGGANSNQAAARVKTWMEKYPLLSRKHKDADGKFPQHSLFYPPHMDHFFLEDLVSLCKNGYGEIEMHLHHNHMNPFPDTPETLCNKVMQCIEDYAKHGIFCLPNGSRRFGFIHGDWSLDNSMGNQFCGVNNEITILKDCGCYADFTFPSLNDAQPAMINKIYYAKDDLRKPKSYNWGKELVVGGRPYGDLLMIPGIIGLRWKSRTHKFRPSIEASNLGYADYPFPSRIDYWIQNGIRIKGMPHWVFIKLHTHGAREDTWDSLLGEKADSMFSYLEKNYNDGKRYMLHYVTAREMYNIIKAAEADKYGNPNLYRDFEIPKYIYLNQG